MSNKEYENMRGRWGSIDRKWNKKAKEEQDRQARHQRSEHIERRMQSKQRKHDKHRLLHVHSLTHRQPLLGAVILPPPRLNSYARELPSAGLLAWALTLLFCQITLGGGQAEETGPASVMAQMPAKNVWDRLNTRRRIVQTWQKWQ